MLICAFLAPNIEPNEGDCGKVKRVRIQRRNILPGRWQWHISKYFDSSLTIVESKNNFELQNRRHNVDNRTLDQLSKVRCTR